MARIHWHILVNDHSGSGLASSLLDQLSDRLRVRDAGTIHFTVHTTQHPGHAGEIGRAILDTDSCPTVAVIGGDGTLHELINGISDGRSGHLHAQIGIVLVPSGTANALYHSLFPSTCCDTEYDRFLSVEAALSTGKSCRPLSLLAVSEAGKHVYTCHVVTSTSLHAQLLETASTPEMRKLYPGTERFRKAAEMHIGIACTANLHLCASATAGVQKWSPQTGGWETLSSNDLHLSAPFTYFVASLVDRFEAKFRITPHSAPEKDRPADAVDILLVRAKSDNREAEAKRLMAVLMAAYSEDGKHLSITEEATDGGGTSRSFVEYYRVTGFEWQPVRNGFRRSSQTRLMDSLEKLTAR